MTATSLVTGEYKYQYGKFSLDENENGNARLVLIQSSEKGGGTKLIREVFKKCIGKNIDLDASYTAHIFFLKMGFMPLNRQCSVSKEKYGVFGVRYLSKIEELFPEIESSLKGGQALSKGQKDSAKYLKDILKDEKPDIYPEPDEITDEQLLSEKDFLLELREKKDGYIKLEFAHMLTQTLKNTQSGERPNTGWWYSVPMTLSEEGRRRWEADIKEEKKFEPFRNFEHLYQFMTPEQVETIRELVIPKP